MVGGGSPWVDWIGAGRGGAGRLIGYEGEPGQTTHRLAGECEGHGNKMDSTHHHVRTVDGVASWLRCSTVRHSTAAHSGKNRKSNRCLECIAADRIVGYGLGWRRDLCISGSDRHGGPKRRQEYMNSDNRCPACLLLRAGLCRKWVYGVGNTSHTVTFTARGHSLASTEWAASKIRC